MGGQLKTQKLKVKTTTQNLKFDRIIEVLLKNRGITTKKQREEFFNPTHPDEFKIYDLSGAWSSGLGIKNKEIGKAVERIQIAIEKQERIIVYGDYDVDGICAAAILWETLHFLGAKALPYIPNRFSEGYGLNIESLKKLKEENPDTTLVVTVDHGITASEKIDLAGKLGIEVIVTDHHEPGETFPAAHAVVHTTKISGSAVAWVVAQSLVKNSKLKIKNLPQDHLGLAALGTVADVLPLVGFNRAFVVHGLKHLRETSRPGIVSLCSEAGIQQEEIDTFHIGFVIAPRLNSMGRLEHALDSLRLLCTRSKGRAQELAFKLGRTNRARQEKTELAFTHVVENFAARWENGGLPKLLFAHHESYEEGVVGIVAARMVEKYYRPSVVVSQGEEFSKGSARSVLGVSIVDMIKTAGVGLLVSGGGHKMAAGFSVRTEHLESLKNKLCRLAQKDIPEEALKKNTRTDMELEFGQISQELAFELARFAPFGFGNPEPVFLTKGVYIQDARLVGRDGKHLKMVVSKKQDSKLVRYQAIAFGMGELYSKLSPGIPVDVVYSLVFDEWNGRKSLQLKVKEMQLGDK